MAEHLIHAKSNKEKLAKFREELSTHKTDIVVLLGQQTVLIVSSNTVTLTRIEERIEKVYGFFASLSDESEDQAADFVKEHGGEEAVQNVSFSVMKYIC